MTEYIIQCKERDELSLLILRGSRHLTIFSDEIASTNGKVIRGATQRKASVQLGATSG